MVKKFNLVYENWENDKYVINGKIPFDEYFFFDPRGLFESYIIYHEGRNDDDDRRIVLNVCKLDDVKNNPNENFFYVIGSPGLGFQTLKDMDDRFFINRETIEMLNICDNFYFIFTMEHEPADDLEVKSFKELLIKNNVPLNKCYYINNNSLSEELSKKYDVNIKKINFIEYSSTDALQEVLNVKFVEEKTGKFFMCRNKTIKSHRANLILHLMINNIIDDVNYSFLSTYYENDYSPYTFSLSNDEILKYGKLIKKINKEQKEDDFEKGKNYYDFNQGGFTTYTPQSKLHYPEIKESYENSYVNIITESIFDSEGRNVIHITEKSFRPFFYYQIPMILGTPHHIKKLKEKYNFDFFEDIIDHSYDNEFNDKKRFFMFLNEIIRINNNKDYVKNFYINNKERFELNRKKLLTKALNKTEDFNLFWDLI